MSQTDGPVPCYKNSPFLQDLFRVKLSAIGPVCGNPQVIEYSYYLTMFFGVVAVLYRINEIRKNLAERQSSISLYALTGCPCFLEWPIFNVKVVDLSTFGLLMGLNSSIRVMYHMTMGYVAYQMWFLQVSLTLQLLSLTSAILTYSMDGRAFWPAISTLVYSTILLIVWCTILCNTQRHFGICQ